MAEMFTLESLVNLAVLIFLQAVLGFDNLLYISIESKRAPEEKRSMVRRVGIVLAIALRVVLLFVVIALLDAFQSPFFRIQIAGVLEGAFNFATLVFLLGGVFVIYISIKEIHHMLELDDVEKDEVKAPKGVARVIFMIVLMNLVFSFDSILSAVVLTRVIGVLVVAILVSGVMMIALADRVAEFLNKNKKYEVLGLFILLIVGVVLLGEGGQEAGLKIFGHPVEKMSKVTFYFSIAVLVIVDVLQSGYQKKLAKLRALRAGKKSATEPEPTADAEAG